MTWTRGLIIAFWIFIGISLLWQCADYTSKIERQASAPATPEVHYFYKKPPLVPEEVITGPKLVQTSFTVEPNTPSPGRFTCRVVVKNVGAKKATHIQIVVRPFFGGRADEGEGRSREPLDANNRLWQISGTLAIPDLEPGQSSPPQSITFDNQTGGIYGSNSNPQIVFDVEKPKPVPKP